MNKRHHLQPSETTTRARELRSESTWPEKIVWGIVRNGRLGGLKFRRQHPFGPYYLDFYCDEVKLVIEVDGASHEDKTEMDSQRTAYLEQRGLRVFRVVNSDVLSDRDAVARGIALAAGVSFDEIQAPKKNPN